jgi:salicylate hydroxylase
MIGLDLVLAVVLSVELAARLYAEPARREGLRRERVGSIQRGARENGLRYDSANPDLGVRDAQIAAHAAFRRRLYDHDVVPEAEAAALSLR